MMIQKTNSYILKGEIINFTYGEYSEFGLVGIFVFVKDCDLKQEVAEYTAEQKDNRYRLDVEALASFLVRRGFALPVDCRNIHLGTYGRFDNDLL